MYKYINEVMKTYKLIYMLNTKYKEITKEQLDEREDKINKLSTLKDYYNDENFSKKVEDEKLKIKEDKDMIAVSYLAKFETKQDLIKRGFSTSILEEYIINFHNRLLVEYNNPYIKTKTISK